MVGSGNHICFVIAIRCEMGLDKQNVSVRIRVASQSASWRGLAERLSRTTTHMKKKVSITLPADVLAKVDQLAGSRHSRSAIIEGVLQNYLRQRERADANAQDLELINAAADELNLEAADVLDYQVIF